jgi:hypothetical protein
MVFKLHSFLPQLLFEERIQHDSGRACVFQAADAVELL